MCKLRQIKTKTRLNINRLNPAKLLQAVAAYMIGIGTIACIWPFVSSSTYLTETTDHNFIQTAKLYTRELCLALGLIIGGISILKKQLWARKLCLTVLALAFFYGGNKIAWLWAGSAAATTTFASAYLLSFLLFGICFFVLFQYLTEENLDQFKHQ